MCEENIEFLTDDWTFICSECGEKYIISWAEREAIAKQKHGHKA